MSDVDISEVVDSTITVEDNFPTREGFGVPMVVGYHHRNTSPIDRVDSVATDGDVADLGFSTDHPIRLACAAMFAQNPRPPIIKIGRRAGTPTRTIRYTPIDTTVGYVYSGTVGGVAWTYTVLTGDTVATVIDGIVTAITTSSLAADDDSILTATATSGSEQVLDSEANGVIALGVLSPPRKITVTRSSHANQDAVTAVLVGVDEYGRAQTENLAFADAGSEVLTSTKLYSRFVSLTIPAQGGTGGTTKIGHAAAVSVTDNTTSMDVASAVAGQWLRHTISTTVKSAELTLEERTADAGTTLATDLTAILAADDDWFGLIVVDGGGATQQLLAAAWAETNQKLLGVDTFDTAAATSATTDVLTYLAAASYYMTAAMYHRQGDGYFPAARWFGRMLPVDPGTETWALKTLAGLPVDNLTGTERTQLKAKHANFYVRVSGLLLTFGYKNGGVSAQGRFIDLVRYVLFLNARIQEAVIAPLANNEKVPLDDFGITIISGEVRGVLKAGEAAGSLRNVVLDVPLIDEVPEADRAERILSGLEWDAIYIGATHKARITGRIGV